MLCLFHCAKWRAVIALTNNNNENLKRWLVHCLVVYFRDGDISTQVPHKPLIATASLNSVFTRYLDSFTSTAYKACTSKVNVFIGISTSLFIVILALHSWCLYFKIAKNLKWKAGRADKDVFYILQSWVPRVLSVEQPNAYLEPGGVFKIVNLWNMG